MFDEKNRYIIKDYQTRPPFSSFLPGIAGEMGIPIWCYYNNRGQAVCSFGVRDKDHSIMEFSPAHVAYRDVSRTGFRTFCKVNGSYRELFTEECDMHIGMSELEITCQSGALLASAVYFGVPEERTAALARILTVTNAGDSPIDLELLDGMSAVVPYGLNQDFLKNMTQLSKAWMQAEDQAEGRAYFRVRASLEDGAVVREVKGGNFCLGWDESGALLKPVVQPSLIFGEDTALTCGTYFRNTPLTQITQMPQVTSNQFLCCFLPKIAELKPGESVTIRSIYGQAESKETVRSLAQRISPKEWFDRKRDMANRLTEQLCSPIHCRTASPVFDAYARQTYLDNFLRGGVPMFFRSGGKTAPFHLYSRKHGDPEREYNFFSLGQEYFAQGNGNYRDVNQNRRSDVLFAPETGAKNIHTFFDLIQTDGYNPLVLTPSTYVLAKADRDTFTKRCPSAAFLLAGFFTPGQVAMAAQDAGMDRKQAMDFTSAVICAAHSEPNADFGEGYWCDHWTYNLDLIENYLAVYPENKEELLFGDPTYRWYETQVLVNPRARRYCLTENGLRQYYALDEKTPKATRKWMQLDDGTDARSTLMEKLLLLCAIKTATLDAAGMGVEMEGGRPGWYDALNGLPGLLGSSMAETCELARLLTFAANALEAKAGHFSLYAEILLLITHVDDILKADLGTFDRWDRMNGLKEAYRKDTMNGFRGARLEASCAGLAAALRRMQQVVLDGIEKAKTYHDGLIPTYFTFTAKEVIQTPDGPMPGKLEPTALPLFLEGPVRYLKLPLHEKEKQSLARQVKESGLYDRKLHMYKVNESLAGVSYEAGRALAFTPGWLENESVWLHMAYKYLLELLKNGLYDEFAQAFRDGAVPFLNPEVYGRSPLENVSFIASSANPDPAIHGRGFVARLSGSTAEFVSMWQVMFFGKEPFRIHDGKLTLGFEPFLPDYLMPEDGKPEATFLGQIPVTYHGEGMSDLIPGKTQVTGYTLHYTDGTVQSVSGSVLDDEPARAVRSGKVNAIQVFMA